MGNRQALRPETGVLRWGRVRPLLICMPLLIVDAQASTYGVFDARTAAMGGAGVAAAGLGEAQFYNPALLALHNGREDKARDNRAALHAVLNYAGPLDTVIDFYEDELDLLVSDTIEEFNDARTSENARTALDAVTALDVVVDDVAEAPLAFDGQLGLSVNLAADREGGAMFLTNRSLVSLRGTIREADQTLLEQYKEALLFLATNGAQGSAQPQLFENGDLQDPKRFIDSDVDVGGVIVTEFGFSMAREYTWERHRFQFGISPKAQRIIVFYQQFAFEDEDLELNYQDNSDVLYMGNFDLGMGYTYGSSWQFGLAVKDILTRSYRFENGPVFRFQPQVRGGASWENPWLTVTVDADLYAPENLLGEGKSQELALGLALHPWQTLEFRAGYRTDLEGTLPDIATAGLGWRLGRFVGDLAVGAGTDTLEAGLRLGAAF